MVAPFAASLSLSIVSMRQPSLRPPEAPFAHFSWALRNHPHQCVSGACVGVWSCCWTQQIIHVLCWLKCHWFCLGWGCGQYSPRWSLHHLSRVCSTSREPHLFSEGKINNISAVLLYLLVNSLPTYLPTLSCGMQWSINFLGSLLFGGSRFLQHGCRNKSVVPLETTRLLQHLRVLYQVQ